MPKMKYKYENYKQFEFVEMKGVKILDCINPESPPFHRKFNAICLCGEPRIVLQKNIIYRNKLRCKKCGWKSCGQYNRKEDAGLNSVILSYKKSAEKRGIRFNISKEDFRKLSSQNCYYCDSPPYQFCL